VAGKRQANDSFVRELSKLIARIAAHSLISSVAEEAKFEVSSGRCAVFGRKKFGQNGWQKASEWTDFVRREEFAADYDLRRI
jgi:hypothetical protein